jgi:long-chain acyl-CoA synthetase
MWSAMRPLQAPKDYVFVETLPKNNYGKILKTDLRAMDAKRETGNG